MAVIVTSTWVRPNTGVDWYVASDSESAYIKTNFRDNGKISTAVTYSNDELTRTSVAIYPNDAARNEWKADSTLRNFKNNRDTYCNNNSISKSISLSS